MKNKELFDEFKNWMEKKGYKATVSASYVSYLRTLLTKLYTGGYTIIPNPEEFFNNIMDYPSLVKGLLEYFDDTIKKAYSDTNCPITQKQLNNGRSAFRKFIEFILWYSVSVKANLQSVANTVPAARVVKTRPSKSFQNRMGWKIYGQKDILDIIKSRLGTQDRVSGNKIWLPIRVIKKVPKLWFDDWCREIIKDTKVLVGYNKEEIVMLNQVEELRLKLEFQTKFSVWVVVGQKEHRVYTRTKKGSIVPLFVTELAEITLDHIKSIDETLRDLENANSLSELSKVSSIAKLFCKATKCKAKGRGKEIAKDMSWHNNQVISRKVGNSVAIDLDELLREMDLIRKDTDYELMHGRENSSKGNRVK